jgi:hypothetical protein
LISLLGVGTHLQYHQITNYTVGALMGFFNFILFLIIFLFFKKRHGQLGIASSGLYNFFPTLVSFDKGKNTGVIKVAGKNI